MLVEDWSLIDDWARSDYPPLQPPLYEILASSKTLAVRSFLVFSVGYVLTAYVAEQSGVDFQEVPEDYLNGLNPFDRYDASPQSYLVEMDFTNKSSNDLWTMIDWIRDSAKGCWSLDVRPLKTLDFTERMIMEFSFENLQDAVLFKLTC